MGIGSSPASSAANGAVLTANGSGTTTWTTRPIGVFKIVPTVSGTGTTVDSIGTVTFTNATDPYITCFSSSFLHYRVILNLTAQSSGPSSFFMRMASGTTANTTAADYRDVLAEQGYASSAWVTAANNGTIVGFRVGRVEGNYASIIIDFIGPQSSTMQTMFHSSYADTTYSGLTRGRMNVTTSYDGINPRINGTATFTGTLEVFGYN